MSEVGAKVSDSYENIKNVYILPMLVKDNGVKENCVCEEPFSAGNNTCICIF